MTYLIGSRKKGANTANVLTFARLKEAVVRTNVTVDRSVVVSNTDSPAAAPDVAIAINAVDAPAPNAGGLIIVPFYNGVAYTAPNSRADCFLSGCESGESGNKELHGDHFDGVLIIYA